MKPSTGQFDGPFYHGTSATLKPGELIGRGKKRDGNATTNMDVARTYATASEGFKSNRSEQLSLFNPVYEVVPDDPKGVQGGSWNNPDYFTAPDFRVKRVAGWAPGLNTLPDN
jgi:hypothetical protein